MSTDRHIDRICLIITGVALIITILFIFGEKLGIKKIVDEDSEGHEAESGFTANDLDGSWDTSDATVITLSGDGADISGNGAYETGGSVYIRNAGKYVISGKLSDGSLVVDAYESSKVWLLFEGVEINCPDDAALRVNSADKVFVTLAEGSVNSLSSGSEYSDSALDDGTGGVIYSHDDLTVNGPGTLDIKAAYKHGIECNDKLVITGGNITIEAPQDGINANDGVNITEATVTISAGDDGISAGRAFLMAGGFVDIDKCYEGIEALTIDVRDGEISIICSDDGLNANGGNSDAGGFGGPGGIGGPGGFGGEGVQGRNNGEGMPEGFGGESMPEGFGGESMPEGSKRPANGSKPGPIGEGTGETSESHMPDGANPPEGPAQTGNDSKETSGDEDEETWIRISGGKVTVINRTGRDADGLDSNGDIVITGGDIRISLPGDGNNCALDWGSESGGKCTVNGGSIIACGGSSMAEAFDGSSEQCGILYIYSNGTEDGDVAALKDDAGNTLLEWEVPCGYTAISLSCPGIETGRSYTIVAGDHEETVTVEKRSSQFK